MNIKWKEYGGDYFFNFKGFTFSVYWVVTNGVITWEACIQDKKKNNYQILYVKTFKTLFGCQKHLVKKIDTIHGFKK